MSNKKNTPKISKATHTRFKAFVKSLLKDDNVDGDVVHEMLESIRINVSKELAGEFLMGLIQTVDDPDAEITNQSHWFGPVPAQYFNVIFEQWYQFLNDENMDGYIIFDNKLYDKLSGDVSNIRTSAMSQMLHFKWKGDPEQNKKANKVINRAYKWMKDTQDGVIPKHTVSTPTPAPKPKPKSKKRWWRK